MNKSINLTSISEDTVEKSALSFMDELGYAYFSPEETSPDEIGSQRATYQSVILQGRLQSAVDRLNPSIPSDAIEEALRALQRQETPNLVEENRQVHQMLVNGIDVEYLAEDGTIRGDKVWLIDFANPENNDWVVTNQFRVVEGKYHRRPDIVVFLNGLPVAVIELKNPVGETSSLDSAFRQIQTYKNQIPSLFRTNCLLVVSDGLSARIGSLTADWERFMPWRSVTGEVDDFTPRGGIELETLLRGAFEKSHLLSLIRDFTVFTDKGDGLSKIVAGYHQFFGARKAFRRAIEASSPEGDRRIGVIWHTQGSGKSLSMAFLGGLLVRSKELKNPTLVVLTDRNDLDNQLFGTFSMCKDLIRQTPEQADSREGLRNLLRRKSGGVVFTTIQKFSPDRGEERFPALTERENVIVIADEAHRSQYGFDARLDRDTGEFGYGYAHYIRQALPKASFIGFTATPIESANTSTGAVFGKEIDVYDISRAVEDEVTVPIFYQSRLARISLDEDEKPRIDAEIESILEDETLPEQEKTKAKWVNVEALVGSEKRLTQVAANLVDHLEERLSAINGKAMAVCMSRQICVSLYEHIKKLRPKWCADDDDEGELKVVMTGSASDPVEWQIHVRNKSGREKIAKRARDPDDPLKLVIVCDMWLTGFDAPCLHTMYIDKPMRGHNLMQAIARVNRVFRNKPGGLIVDYIGILQYLKEALAEYSDADRKRVGVEEEDAIAALKEKLDIVRKMFHGHDYQSGISGEPKQRFEALGLAMNWILDRQEKAAAQKDNEKGKATARRRFQSATAELVKAFALAAASDFARGAKDEVGFFQSVRLAMMKTSPEEDTKSKARLFAIKQLIEEAIANAEIIDILKAVGMKSPDISILSEEFLMEMKKMEQKNLALEALKKLLNDEIVRLGKRNVVLGKTFSQRLEEIVAKYHSNSISTVEAIQRMIDLAKDYKSSIARGEKEGISEEELLFYDALAENDSAVEVMGDENLRIIAVELVKKMKSSVTVDWHKKESARARMRSLIRRILKKHGYPPDLAGGAIQTVIAQAEAVLAEISSMN
ncbi:type I restriction endonuclease subunit R [Thioalkalivibrio sp. HK1]|uniref:type I restriction endonuclease subunit R n=1 Tax=Thioalkalivibrio sp. HK1 TaxID=1469245 RepID=UPI0004715E93|nr:type I restriction endonuclease subunit R [Thioalkalivibrio sp. HK1]